MNSQPEPEPTYKFEDLPLKDVVRVMRSQAEKLAKQEIRITQTMDTAESNYKSMERERLELNGKLVAECDRADELESSNKAQALELKTMTNARNSLLAKEETHVQSVTTLNSQLRHMRKEISDLECQKERLTQKANDRVRMDSMKITWWKFIALAELCATIFLAWKYSTE